MPTPESVVAAARKRQIRAETYQAYVVSFFGLAAAGCCIAFGEGADFGTGAIFGASLFFPLVALWRQTALLAAVEKEE
jgi:hypothetical protein